MSSAHRNPLLSVITVTRNDSDGLRKTLQSLQTQIVDWSRLEHVIVDGASTDDTRETIQEFALPVTTFSSEPDRGVFDAMNKGLARSHGKYIQFLNSGDAFAGSHSLAQVCEALTDRPVWLVAGAVDEHGGKRPATRIRNIPHVWWRHALGLQPHCHQTTIISRELLESLNGHDEHYGFVADFDVVLRAGLIAAPAVLDDVVVRYEGGGMSAQRQEEIPHAIAQVRAERFDLTGVPAKLNSALARWQSARIKLGRQLGR